MVANRNGTGKFNCGLVGASSHAYYLGVPVLSIDIGGTKTAVALIDDGKISDQQVWRTPAEAGAVEVRRQIVVRTTPWRGTFDACGISFGGPFDFAGQRCRTSLHVQGWEDFPITAWAQEEFGVPCVTDNDANVAALGEVFASSDLRESLVLYATVSTGVGGSVVMQGRVLRGSHSLAGELGHVYIGHDKQCGCGQAGCLERAVSGYWILRDHGVDAATYLADPRNRDSWLDFLAQGLWSAIAIIDPAAIIIGGGIVNLGDPMRTGLESRMADFAQRSHREAPQIRLGDPTGATCLLGAAVLVQEGIT